MGQSTARKAEIAERRQRAVQMRLKGHPWSDIAAALGYGSPHAACQDVGRALDAARTELAQSVEQLREQELQHLYTLRAKVHEVLERRHVLVSAGKVVRDWPLGVNGEPLAFDADGNAYPLPDPMQDDGPVLAAVDRLVKVEERIARLTGIDAPQRVEATGTINYIIEGVDMEKLR